MHSVTAALRMVCLLLALWATGAKADVDDSTDLFLTFNQPTMRNTSLFPYHQSISAWYETFLKIALQRKAFPVDGYADESDFAPIFQELQARYPNQKVVDIGDNQWAELFVTKGQELAGIADDLVFNNSAQDGIKYYLAANLFRLAYFPWIHEETSTATAKQLAWKMDKRAFRKAIDLMDDIDFAKAYATVGGDEDHNIPLRIFRPKDYEGPMSVVIIITGLDHYHTYTLNHILELTSIGISVVVVPMPGTADSPITGRDELAKEKYWTAIVDWIEYNSELFDRDCINLWGISTGSYWAVLASRAERWRLKRVVSQGTASHYTFTRSWLEAAENLAYPASLQRALGQAFGYPDAEAFKKDVEQFSLLTQGVLDQDGAPLIAINGEKDTIFPIDDQRILAEHGPGAQLRWFPHVGHNGEPMSSAWLSQFWAENGAC
ncbi:related to yellowish-green 1 (ayg1) [Melanopsichium pennsylvanicum]|uniref:Related to yellowish-green 1 (Ayg1) n=1 Tax=Melanopsichium pennsylvanicum TaxID=63383 RepID=A0AAJ4XNT7_9BASI|nr:related to yellowish-green 1 (ayg1) [Melanopsichium pennsylvanicum]